MRNPGHHMTESQEPDAGVLFLPTKHDAHPSRAASAGSSPGHGTTEIQGERAGELLALPSRRPVPITLSAGPPTSPGHPIGAVHTNTAGEYFNA